MESLRILVAEDNEVNQTFAKMLLEREGHMVVTVNNGVEVLEKLEQQRFDVVLMDVRMPRQDGVETTQRIRSSPEMKENRSVPIIAITASTYPGDKERFLKAGMDDYIAKPMTWGSIVAAIERVRNS